MLQALRSAKQNKERKEEKQMYKKLLIAVFVACLVSVPMAVFAAPTDQTIAGAHSTRTITVNYTRDASGALIGQTQTIHEVGVDIDGVAYTSDTTVNYVIFQGQGKVLDSKTVSTTERKDASGNVVSSETSTTFTDYSNSYDSGGRLINAPTGSRDVSGSNDEYEDSEGNLVSAGKYTGHYDMAYTIIAGSAYVESMTGTTINSAIDEATGTYVENSTTESTVTYEYIQINGDVLTKSTNAVSRTTQVAADASGRHYFTETNVTTTYEYDQTTGSVISASGSGTGNGYLLTGAGNQEYTSTIAVTYAIKNGMAVQTKYTEVQNFGPPPAVITPGTQDPVYDDPAVQGTVQDASVVASGVKADGTRDYYVYVVVYASAFDDTIGDGEWEEKDGEQYLVRINCGSDKAKADSLAASYISQRGTVRSFFGNLRPNTNIIDALGNGAGPFDLPGL